MVRMKWRKTKRGFVCVVNGWKVWVEPAFFGESAPWTWFMQKTRIEYHYFEKTEVVHVLLGEWRGAPVVKRRAKEDLEKLAGAFGWGGVMGR